MSVWSLVDYVYYNKFLSEINSNQEYSSEVKLLNKLIFHLAYISLVLLLICLRTENKNS